MRIIMNLYLTLIIELELNFVILAVKGDKNCKK